MLSRIVAALRRIRATTRRVTIRIGLLPLAFFALMALPGLAHVTGLGRQAAVTENRRPAPPPGLRASMVSANNWLRWRAFGELATPRIVVGRNGRLLLVHDANVLTGLGGLRTLVE